MELTHTQERRPLRNAYREKENAGYLRLQTSINKRGMKSRGKGFVAPPMSEVTSKKCLHFIFMQTLYVGLGLMWINKLVHWNPSCSLTHINTADSEE